MERVRKSAEVEGEKEQGVGGSEMERKGLMS